MPVGFLHLFQERGDIVPLCCVTLQHTLLTGDRACLQVVCWFPILLVFVAANQIGLSGAMALGEMLKVNDTLFDINLTGEPSRRFDLLNPHFPRKVSTYVSFD